MDGLSVYQPNEQVLAALQEVTVVAVVGPSGSGKTTLINRAKAQDSALHAVVSDVSRPARPEEQDGVDYFFRDKQSMIQSVARREYVQVALSTSGYLYATHIEQYARQGITIVPVWADAIPAFRALPFGVFRTIFIVPPDYYSWQEHMGLHKFDESTRQKRLVEARRSFNFALNQPDVQFVINDDLEVATTEFIELAHGRTNDKLQSDQVKAREIIQTILQQLPL